ncbi:MAG: hypothetical protein BWY88_00722 [Synergistetes bacterium ADurb.Bin520]|nr:MAG: hypothetical protein BWY88_00722 [Synergistetes bacterium ADurb.Bin520]
MLFLVGVAVLKEVFPFLLQKAVLSPAGLQVRILAGQGVGGLADPECPLFQGVVSHLDGLVEADLFVVVLFPPLFAGAEGLADVLQGFLGEGCVAPGGQPLAEVLSGLVHVGGVGAPCPPGGFQGLEGGSLVVGRVLSVELRGVREFPEPFPILSPLRQLVCSDVPLDDGVLGAAQGFVLLVLSEFGVVFPALLGDVFAPLLPDAAELELGLGDALPGIFLVFGVPLQLFLHGALLVRDPGPAVVELLELPLAPGQVGVGGVGEGKLAPGEGVFPGAAQGAGLSVPQRLSLVLQGLDAQEQIPLGLQKFGLPGQRFQTRFGALPIFLQGALAVGEFLGAPPGVFQQELVFFPELESLEPLI